MRINNYTNQIRKITSKGELKKAFQETENYLGTDSEFSNLLINLSSRLNRAESEYCSGSITRSEYELEINKVNNSFLNLLKDIDNSEEKFDIFLCYNFSDKPYVMTVFGHLKEKNYNICFTDDIELLERGIRNSDIYIVFYRNNSDFYQSEKIKSILQNDICEPAILNQDIMCSFL